MTSIRNLIALYITVLLLPISLLIFQYTSNLKVDYSLISDEIALNELREILLISYNLNFNENELNFLYQDEEYRLSLINNKLLLKPGTMIYLTEVNDLNFFIKDNSIYLKYFRKGKEYEKVLMGKESLYLDDFASCDDECLEHCDVDEFLPVPQE